MGQGSDNIDWSEERWKRHLIGPRKFLWAEDTVAKLTAWLGLEHGMRAIDVGCGLGYLGYTYWPYFGEGGRYFGVDKSPELLRDAAQAARDWALGGEAHFIAGDVLRLPFPDDFADWVMCQTLLMHQREPRLALTEMVRVARPGGLIMCKEPDNLSSMMAKRYSSLPELDIEAELLLRKVALISNKGRIKLGRGDMGIGNKVPMMMKEMGLTDIDARNNDHVNLVQPPYEGSLQQHRIEMTKLYLGLDRDEEEREFWWGRRREEFLAGGGEPGEFQRYRGIQEKNRLVCEQQIHDGEYFQCSAAHLYVIKGRKPK